MNKRPAPFLPSWLETMIPYQRYCVDVGGRTMHVMETGEGTPVLLLHGNPTWGFLYRQVANRLTGGNFRIIMPDLIGLGLSDKPAAKEHTLDNHIRWMADFIAQLNINECVMAVQDWGGAIGVGALAEHPDLRAGLVVMNTVLTPPRKGFRPKAFHRFANMPVVSDTVFRLGGFPQSALWVAQGDRNSIRGEVARAYRYPLRDRRTNVAPLALARMVPGTFDHPTIEGLARCQRYVETFDGPAALVWGKRDPVLGGVLSWMTKLFPNAPVTQTNAGHFLQEEVPDEITAAIIDVAKRGEQTAAKAN